MQRERVLADVRAVIDASRSLASCNDYWAAGYGRIIMVPRVKLCYDKARSYCTATAHTASKSGTSRTRRVATSPSSGGIRGTMHHFATTPLTLRRLGAIDGEGGAD